MGTPFADCEYAFSLSASLPAFAVEHIVHLAWDVQRSFHKLRYNTSVYTARRAVVTAPVASALPHTDLELYVKQSMKWAEPAAMLVPGGGCTRR